MSGRRPIGPVGRNVAANIRRLRMAQEITHREMAERIKATGSLFHLPMLSRLENGDRHIDVDELVVFAEILGVTPTDLLKSAPECKDCKGSPPVGFKCRHCGAVA